MLSKKQENKQHAVYIQVTRLQISRRTPLEKNQVNNAPSSLSLIAQTSKPQTIQNR